jgi:hypothetical protein
MEIEAQHTVNPSRVSEITMAEDPTTTSGNSYGKDLLIILVRIIFYSGSGTLFGGEFDGYLEGGEFEGGMEDIEVAREMAAGEISNEMSKDISAGSKVSHW